VEEVGDLLGISVELAHAIRRRLSDLGIIQSLTDPFTTKVIVADHLAIEKLPKVEREENALARELEKFQASKKDMDKKVADIQAELERKKKAMFADVEKMFKKEANKGKND
jgi:predicted  nucleic acid-binding Zn-ribbon protein